MIYLKIIKIGDRINSKFQITCITNQGETKHFAPKGVVVEKDLNFIKIQCTEFFSVLVKKTPENLRALGYVK